MELIQPGAVMLFCKDPEASATWWADLCGKALHFEDGFWWFMVGDVEFGFHPADESKNPTGSSTVPYWIVPDLLNAIEEAKNKGGKHIRGPLQVSENRQIAQVRDPFGAVIGFEQRLSR